jgi:hypothetical protein
LKNIHPQYFTDLLPLRFCDRNKVFPVGILVPDKSPVDPESEIEEKEESGYKMNEPNGTEPVPERCFRTAGNSNWPANKVTRDGKDYNAQGIDPVVKPHGELPHVYFFMDMC